MNICHAKIFLCGFLKEKILCAFWSLLEEKIAKDELDLSQKKKRKKDVDLKAWWPRSKIKLNK